MKATDANLGEIARQAGVRASIVFHCFHYRQALKGKATAEGYAAFAAVPLEAVERTFSALDSIPQPAPKAKRATTVAYGLPEGFTAPDEWIHMARAKRFWPLDVCKTEAENFIDWHRSKGNKFADWPAAFRTWIKRSNREDGKPDSNRDWTDPNVLREAHQRTIKVFRSMGRHDEANELERELEGL